jgi:hypothetical protein
MQIVKTDEGMVNARIFARESKADFRRVLGEISGVSAFPSLHETRG